MSAVTYQLNLNFPATVDRDSFSQSLTAFLFEMGVTSFQEEEAFENEEEKARFSIFSFDRGSLESIGAKCCEEFLGLSTEILQMETSEWRDAWKDSFMPVEAGRFFVYAPWHVEELKGKDDKIKIEIDPGIAFGTGQHQTTYLCLMALDFLEKNLPEIFESPSVFDLGTGSGILAIAAAKMVEDRGSKVPWLFASDVEIDAVNAAKENLRVNSVQGDVSIESFPGETDRSRGLFKIIFANIELNTLRKLLPDTKSWMSRGGVVIVSGILREQTTDMDESFEELGLKVLWQESKEDWAVMVARHEG